MKPWKVTCMHGDGEIERRLFYPGDVVWDREGDAEVEARAFYERRTQSGKVMLATLHSPWADLAVLHYSRGF